MRPSGKRHPRGQFVDQFPSDTILFRPKTTFRRVPSKQDFTIKRTDEAVTLIMMKGCNATLRHVSRTHHVDLCWLFDPINLDGSIFRYVRTTEQLADILTTGAFATIQWKSLMKLFDIHSPSDVGVDRSLFRIILFCRSSKDSSRDVERLQISARLQKWTVTHTEYALLGETHCQNNVGSWQELKISPPGNPRALPHKKDHPEALF